MKRLLYYYSFIFIALITIGGFTAATAWNQLLPAILSFPLMVYFGLAVAPKRTRAILLPKQQGVTQKGKKEEVIETAKVTKIKPGFDIDRRAFLKIIGSAGITIFLFSLFTKKAEAAFFGSNPGPGIVGIKDSTGTLIDPSKHHPTDGYKISGIDDSSPAFYGFVNKDGDWFIMKEEADGDYLYYKKLITDDDFETEWPNRGGFSYGYFNTKFSG